MPRIIATPPLDGMLVRRRVIPPAQRYIAGINLYTWMKRDKVEYKIRCLSKQRDGRGFNPLPPDPEFELSTARPHTPPQV